MGRALRRSLPRHVRVRGLGRRSAPAAARPRSARRQAALLRRGAGRDRLRLGDQVAARGSRGAARLERRGARRLPDAALHPGAGHDLPRHPQAAAGAPARRRARPRSGPRATGISSSPATATPAARRNTSRSSTRCCAKRSSCAWSATCRSARSSPAASTRARSWPTWSKRARRRRSRSRSASRTRRSTKCEHAETVARHLGCEFHALTVSPHVEELLPKLAWHFDEPFADSSAVPTYYVSKAARELVTVALSGDGGDELWAGYARHRVEHWEQRVRAALGPATRAAGWLGQALPLSVKGARSLRHLARRPRSGLRAQARLRHVRAGREGPALLRRLPPRRQRPRRVRVVPRRVPRLPSSDPLDRSMYVDVQTYMVDDVLTKVDRMSMAVSLEAREPLLDHKLLEFAARVPASLKLKDGQSKYLLRRVLEKRVPRSIVERKKSGFAAPIGEWLRGPLAPMADELLLDGRLRRPRHLQPRARSRGSGSEHRSRPARSSPSPLAARSCSSSGSGRSSTSAGTRPATARRRHRRRGRRSRCQRRCRPERFTGICAGLRESSPRISCSADDRRAPAADARRHRASRPGRCG